MKLVRSAFTESILSLILAAGSVMAITFAVILLVPTPEPRAMSVTHVAQAFTDPNTEDKHGLSKRSSNVEPSFTPDQRLVRNTVLELILAAKLQLEPINVRVFGPAGATVTRLNFNANGRQSPLQSVSQTTLPSPSTEGFPDATLFTIDNLADNTRLMDTLADLEVTSLEVAAIKLQTNEWVIFQQEQPFWTGWRLQALLAFGLSMIALLPIAWLASNRLSQPLRDLADLADSSQLGQDLEPSTIGGAKEIRCASDALSNMHQRLRADAAQRARVVAALAHDLRTPLTSLRVRIETAVSDSARDKMAFDIRRMEQMIQDMMMYSKGIDKTPDKIRINLQDIVATCLNDASMQHSIRRTGLLTPLWINGHSLSMQRAINNLLVNAIQYGTNAEIELATDHQTVLIIVSNDCENLSKDDLTRLLEPFERGEQSRNRDTGGTGLGLSIARDISRFHDGSLMIKNTAKGIKVELALPLAK